MNVDKITQIISCETEHLMLSLSMMIKKHRKL